MSLMIRTMVAIATSMTVGSLSAEPVSCAVSPCAVGSIVKSAPPSGGLYLVCPTAELSEYANTVLGVASLSQSLGVTVPPPSPITGEPSYTGETKVLFDRLRNRAGVRTFDEAASHCQRGSHNQLLVIKASASQSILVSTRKSPSQTFWMPANAADATR